MATKSMPNVKLNVQFTRATTLANIVSEENIVTSFGKLALWYDKLNATHAFTNNIGVSITTPGTSDADKFLKADGTWAIPTNTDTKVTQNNSTANSELRVLLSNSASDTNETNVVNKSVNLTMNPSTGVVSINTTEFGGLQINRPSDGFASVIFRNSSGKLGSVGMNTVNGYLIRHLFSSEGGVGERVTVLDAVNTTFTQTLTSGTALGTITIGDTTKTIYGPTVPTSLKNPNALTVKGNTTTAFTYDGSAAKTLTIKPGTGISVTADTSGNITIGNTVTNTDTKVTLKGATGYVHGAEELNRICKELYSSGSLTARSMTVEDINKAVGYDQTTYNNYGKEYT